MRVMVKEDKLENVIDKLSDLQDMYAHNRYGVLICLGMDTSVETV
jgi:hypothetical protein